MLEEAVLRSPASAPAVLRWLLESVTHAVDRRPRAVTKKYLFAAAGIYKRYFQPDRSDGLDLAPSEFRESVFRFAQSWMAESPILSVELMRCVFQNFQIGCTRGLGMPIDFHFRCHCAFEELYLRELFTFLRNTLEQLLGHSNETLNALHFQTLIISVDILVDLLQWNWNATVSLSTYIWAAVRSLNERTSVSASEEWKKLISQPYLFRLFSSLFSRFRRLNPDLARLALRGLEQLASFLISTPRGSGAAQSGLSEPSFISLLIDSSSALLESLLLNSATNEEVFMASGVLARLAANQHVKLLMALPNWSTFLQNLGQFSELCAQRLLELIQKGSHSSEEAAEIELSPQMASFTSVLHAWAIFAKYAVYRAATDRVNRADHPPALGSAMTSLRESLGLIYQLFVHVRLSVAHAEMISGLHDKNTSIKIGTSFSAKLKSVSGDDGSDAGLPGDEETADQLVDGSIVGRAHLHSSIPLIGGRLKQCLDSLKSLNLDGENRNSWNQIVEELHWLLLLSGHLIADSSEWELTSSIPVKLNSLIYSIQF